MNSNCQHITSYIYIIFLFPVVNRYYRKKKKNLLNEAVGTYAVKKLLLKMLSLGFYTNDTKLFSKQMLRMLRKCSEVATRASFL